MDNGGGQRAQLSWALGRRGEHGEEDEQGGHDDEKEDEEGHP